VELIGSTPDEFRAYRRRDQRFERTVKATGIKLD
jgi:hypothetical protein